MERNKGMRNGRAAGLALVFILVLSASAAEPPRLTREKYDEVKVGMTLREVEAILGPAQKRRRDACTWFRCDNPNVLVTVVFEEGSITRASRRRSSQESLERAVEEKRTLTEKAVASYVPKVTGRLDDLAAPVAEMLRQLPGVAEVEVLVAVTNPTHRIIHLRDLHSVPADLFAQDVRHAAKKTLSDQEVTAFTKSTSWRSIWSGLSRRVSSAVSPSIVGCGASWLRGSPGGAPRLPRGHRRFQRTGPGSRWPPEAARRGQRKRCGHRPGV
jgi:hypothetical protein